jgi:hypothetical protein
VRHDDAVVVETQFAAQLIDVRAIPVGLDGEPRARGENDLFVAQFFRQIERRQSGLAQQLGQKFLALRDGDPQRTLLAQQGNPSECAVVLIERSPFPREEDTRILQHERRG